MGDPLVNALILGKVRYCQKLDSLGLLICKRQYGSIFNHFNVIAEFGRIMKIMAIMPFKIIQGKQFSYQSEAHMWLPISDYLTYMRSCTIYKLLQIIGQICALKGYLSLTHQFRVNP